MVSKEDLKKDSMWFEADDRLELMKAAPKDRWTILMNRALDFKVVVNHKEKSVRRVDITDEELAMIKTIEERFNFICYYLIQDEGVWPDGCSFDRYTLMYVSEHDDEYEMDKEDAIKVCGTVPVYIVNMEDDDCSEITECKFMNVGGLLINAS